MEKRGLGKGLGALLSESTQADAGSVRQIGLERIRPNPFQPRRDFDDGRLDELAQSIREHGVLQPVLVRRAGADSYELIAGERRFRASQRALLKTIPAIVSEHTDAEMLEIALIENVQREDINAIDAASAYRRLLDEFGLSHDDLARRVGKSRPTITNTLRLLGLPEEAQDAVRRDVLSEGHGRALLGLPADLQQTALDLALQRRMSVRELERMVGDWKRAGTTKGMPRPRPVPAAPDRPDPNHAAVEEALGLALATKVTVRKTGGIGRLEIEFYSEEELEGIIERIIG